MTLFKQLYIGTLAVLLLTAAVLSLAFHFYLEQDAINDFIDDVTQETSAVQHDILSPNSQERRLQLRQSPDCQRFCISWLTQDDLTAFTRKWSLLQKSDNSSVYEHPEACRLAALYAYPDLQGYLSISDRPGQEEQCGDEGVDETESIALFPWLYILLGATGVASVLFFLSNRIERAIHRLQNVVSAYAINPAQRADENSPEPVQQLATSFNQLADRLDEQHQEQQVITHAIAHELRTPLARMRLALGMVNSQSLTPQNQALLDDLDRYVSDMDQLTKEVLLFGQLNQHGKQPPPDAINFSQLLEQRLSFLPDAQRAKIRCTAQANIQITMTGKHLQVLIDNLLNNALAYAKSNVSITLEQKTHQSGDTALRRFLKMIIPISWTV